jgi:hypothetical protein
MVHVSQSRSGLIHEEKGYPRNRESVMNTEVKVAIITTLGAIVATISTAVFTDWFHHEPQPDPNPKPIVVPEPREQGTVDVTIRGDVSWAEKLTEYRLIMSTMELDIEIAGQDRGTLDIERFTETEDELPVTLDPGAGNNYTIQGTAEFSVLDPYTGERSLVSWDVWGQDEIVVSEEDHQTFDVVIKDLSLEDRTFWVELE